MIILYSGSRSKCVAPEEFLANSGEAGFMLTYSDFHPGSIKNESRGRFKNHRKKIRKSKNEKTK